MGFCQQAVQSLLYRTEIVRVRDRSLRRELSLVDKAMGELSIEMYPLFLPSSFQGGTIPMPDAGKEEDSGSRDNREESRVSRFEGASPGCDDHEREFRKHPPVLPQEIIE
jgi:hypothetical protein